MSAARTQSDMPGLRLVGQSPFSPLLTLPHEDEMITISAPASHKLKLQQYGRLPFLPDLLWGVSGNK